MSKSASRRLVLVFALLCPLVLGVMASTKRSASAMVAAGSRFLAALSPDQRQQVSLPFDSDERFRFNYIPDEQFARQGLPLKAMTEPQRKLAHDLLRTGLSQRGYMTVSAIIQLETLLRALESGQFARDPDAYRFSMFGTPSTTGAWGWRVDGHHVSLHFTIVKGTMVASSPTFAGTNPAEIRQGPRKGERILAPQEDAARALLMTLDARQRSTAIFNDVAPNDIVTRNAARVDALSPAGIKAAAMTPKQRELLMQLIAVYTSMMADDISADRLAKLRAAGLDNIAFAWAGGMERGNKYYYRIQGPTFLVEYDNSQNDANHVHTIWRDFDGDFGRDLLRDHVKTAGHKMPHPE